MYKKLKDVILERILLTEILQYSTEINGIVFKNIKIKEIKVKEGL